MTTLADPRKVRRYWVRRLWPFPVIGRPRPENPRVGGSTPSQATNPQQVAGDTGAALALHLQHAAGGIAFLGALLAPVVGIAQAPQSTALRGAVLDTAWIGGAAAADLGTTWWAEARCPSCYEANGLMRSNGARIGVKLGTTAAAAWACHELRRHGHKGHAKLLRWTLVAVWSGVAVNNAIRARRR